MESSGGAVYTRGENQRGRRRAPAVHYNLRRSQSVRESIPSSERYGDAAYHHAVDLINRGRPRRRGQQPVRALQAVSLSSRRRRGADAAAAASAAPQNDDDDDDFPEMNDGDDDERRPTGVYEMAAAQGNDRREMARRFQEALDVPVPEPSTLPVIPQATFFNLSEANNQGIFSNVSERVERMRDTRHKNYWKHPQINRFMNEHAQDLIVDDKYLNLEFVREWWAQNWHGLYDKHFKGDDKRSDPLFSNDKFIINEMRKMYDSVYLLNPKWIFPILYGANKDRLYIPISDVRDLPLFVFLYMLKILKDLPRQGSHLGIKIDLTKVNVRSLSHIATGSINMVLNREGRPIVIRDNLISIPDLEDLYVEIMRRLVTFFPTTVNSNSTWNGSEDSGVRIMLRLIKNYAVILSLLHFPSPVASIGHEWTKEIEDLLRTSVGNCVLTARNTADKKCLIYCLIIGLIVKMKQGARRIFGTTQISVDTTEVYCRALYLNPEPGDDPDIIDLIKYLAKLTETPVFSLPSNDPGIQVVKEIDADVGRMMSIGDFRDKFREIEAALIPNKLCGIDVYGMDFNVNRHIYPLYISQTRERVLELLVVTPVNSSCSHFCVIMNMERLLQNSGGKQFISCSKCGECFYHRRLLKDHQCPKDEMSSITDEDGYHFSNKEAAIEDAPVVGVCTKCRLKFCDTFSLNYHMTHCLMQGQTGYRHVQLVTYERDEHPTLNGEEINMESENKHVQRRRIMYADFESSIDPNNGEHRFMSYGIYEWATDEYKCGYDLDEFLHYIIDVAYSHDEDQIYVYFHNAMGYDANFVLRQVMRNPEYSSWGIQVIMKSSNRLQKLVFYTRKDEKARAIHIGDTFLFLTLSLERIVDSIRKDDVAVNEDNFTRFFHIFRQRYPWVSTRDIDHVLRKNIFPYNFFTDASKLDTPIDQFLAIFEPRDINLGFFGEKVTLNDLIDSYDDTSKVIDIFKLKSARDYHDLYLCCDVMQLADVFNRSMEILWESHHIHLTRYLGMPSASWAAFLRHDPTMSIPLYEDTFYAEFFKGMIRGGITSAPLRYAIEGPDRFIIYADVNGLYPYVMMTYKFPCGKFDFISLNWSEDTDDIPARLNNFFAMFERENKGMCFCVDMEIPDWVKVMTDMYPFAPEHRRIYDEYFTDETKEKQTPFLERWTEANEGKTMKEFIGLVCTLYNKERYNVHWRLLKFYLEHGVKITKVWFGVMFNEGYYLQGYIRKNIMIRNGRKDELGKTLYKLLGNSIYGKTFESPFKRSVYEIVRDWTKLSGMMNEGQISSITPIDNLGWVAKIDGTDIILDKPTYIGACVCEYAKLHMYTLLYDKFMKMFPCCQLVYTDTDSFILQLDTPKEEKIRTPKQLFAYIKKQDPELFGNIGGQIKSETGEDDTIHEIIALRSKVYSYVTRSGHMDKRAKGTTHAAQEMQLDWLDFKKALEECKSISTRNVQFVRKAFNVGTVEVVKESLTSNDGKRDIQEDGIHTHAFGYPKNMTAEYLSTLQRQVFAFLH